MHGGARVLEKHKGCVLEMVCVCVCVRVCACVCVCVRVCARAPPRQAAAAGTDRAALLGASGWLGKREERAGSRGWRATTLADAPAIHPPPYLPHSSHTQVHRRLPCIRGGHAGACALRLCLRVCEVSCTNQCLLNCSHPGYQHLYVKRNKMKRPVSGSSIACSPPQVFIRERLNGYYSVATFALANTLASAPFIFGIAVISSAVVYWLVGEWLLRCSAGPPPGWWRWVGSARIRRVTAAACVQHLPTIYMLPAARARATAPVPNACTLQTQTPTPFPCVLFPPSLNPKP